MCLTLRPHGLESSRLLCPWDSPSKNTGVGRHALLQGIFLTQGSNSRLLCLLYWQAILCRFHSFLPMSIHRSTLNLTSRSVSPSPSDCFAGQHSLFPLCYRSLRTFQKSVGISDSPPCSTLHLYTSLSLWTPAHISVASGEEAQLNSACSSTELEAFAFILLL